ncbi:hypothetical protein ACFX12_031864 [Malus domestica]
MKPAFKRSNSQTLDSNLGTNPSFSLRRKSTTCSQFQVQFLPFLLFYFSLSLISVCLAL